MQRIVLWLFSIGLPLFLSSQNQTMTPELLWKLGRVSLDDVSPDGQKFLYAVTHYSLKENKGQRKLYLYQLTNGKVVDLSGNLKKSLSGGHFVGKDEIAFLHDGQLKIAKSDGSNRRNLTNIEGGISGGKAYHQKDGSVKILFHKKFDRPKSPDIPDYSELPKAEFKIMDDLMYRHWDSWDEGKMSHLCLTEYKGNAAATEFRDLMKGQPYSCPVPPFGGSESYSLSPDGQKVVYETKAMVGKDFAEQTNTHLYLLDLNTDQLELLTKGMDGYDKNPAFSPGGDKLAWLSMATNGYESDVNNLIVLDLKSKEKRAVLNDELYDQYTFNSFAWKSESEIYAGVPTAGTNQVYVVRLGGKKIGLQALTSGEYNYNHFAPAKNGLVVERQDINHATEIYMVEGKGKAQQLTAVNDEIYDKLSTSRVEKRMIAASDGKEILTWVIYPPDFDPTKKYPTLLYCQGGPQAQVSQFYSFRWNFQLMAAQGYIVVAPNRRGLPGFGREWNEAISGDWGGQPIRDYLSAIDALADEPYVDEEKLGAVGASYGGYSVYLLAGVHEGRFKSFVSHCGLFDLESWYLSTEEMFFANYDLGGPFWDPALKEDYRKFDPKDHLHKWDTPILVIHGGKDFRVPENQGMEAFQAAQLRNVPSRFLYFPNEGHWVLSPQNGLVWHNQFFGWLQRWLQPID